MPPLGPGERLGDAIGQRGDQAQRLSAAQASALSLLADEPRRPSGSTPLEHAGRRRSAGATVEACRAKVGAPGPHAGHQVPPRCSVRPVRVTLCPSQSLTVSIEDDDPPRPARHRLVFEFHLHIPHECCYLLATEDVSDVDPGEHANLTWSEADDEKFADGSDTGVCRGEGSHSPPPGSSSRKRA